MKQSRNDEDGFRKQVDLLAEQMTTYRKEMVKAQARVADLDSQVGATRRRPAHQGTCYLC